MAGQLTSESPDLAGPERPAQSSLSGSPPPPPGHERPKVIYVVGAGRSGSTILGVALGNCAHVFYAGELDKWLARSGVPQLEDPQRTVFWNRVRDGVQAADLYGHQAQRCLERSSALLRIREWPARRRLRERYRRVCEDVYRTIARETGAIQIVDTSHYPLRAWELRALPGIELYLLFLVRDPQSVVASLGRRDAERRFGVLAANGYMWLTYLLSTLVFLRHPHERRMFLRHEDFVEDPASVLRQILDRVGSTAEAPDLTSLKTGIPLQGNRLLKAQVIALERETAPRGHRSLTTKLLQLPWALVFSRLKPVVAPSLSPRHGAGRTEAW